LDPDRIVTCGKVEKKILTKKQEVNQDILKEACHEMHSRWFSTKASLEAQNKNENNFKMSPKTVDDPIQNISIPINGKKEKNGKKKSVTWNQNSFSFWPKTKIGGIYVKRKREIQRLNKLSP